MDATRATAAEVEEPTAVTSSHRPAQPPDRHPPIQMTVTTLVINSASVDPTTRRTLSNLSLSVAKSRKIVVVTGAGISCSCGIPDFRSSDGLYALVKQQYPDVVLKGRDLFDASLFRDPTSASVFYTFISKLKQSIDKASPSPTHRFIKTLSTKGKLLRSYTQNIDGLEDRIGLLSTSSEQVKSSGKGKSKIKMKDVRNVQLHGDIHRVRCTFCSADFPCAEEYLISFNKGIPPDCPECSARSKARVARSARALKVGTLRPAIVLYDEPHPLGDDIGAIQSADLARRPDLLIIMGTSLKVHGLKKLVKEFARAVHGSSSATTDIGSKTGRAAGGKVIFVNKTAPGAEWTGVIDFHVVGETDAWVEKVLEDWKKMRPSDWEVQKTLAGDGSFKTTKEASTTGKSGAKKKANPDSENVPPPRAVTSLPVAASSVIPLSPGKRRQAASHYCDVESSPSKKRGIKTRPHIVMEERGPLFRDVASNASSTGDVFGGKNLVEVVIERKKVGKKMVTTVDTLEPLSDGNPIKVC